jgi:hypothetical protein
MKAATLGTAFSALSFAQTPCIQLHRVVLTFLLLARRSPLGDAASAPVPGAKELL